ncbi:MAG: diacylglycerol kinase family protein [Pyrinomonadaceae bacterium]
MPLCDVILNSQCGSFVENETEQQLRDEFARVGINVNIHLAAGSEVESIASKAAGGDADIVVVGGGDGTVNTVATALRGKGKLLGILPLGTLNHFSKDLGVPQVLTDAVNVIASGMATRVDVGEVNGRLFLNNSSIGLYPRIVRRREMQQERLGRGKWSAALIAALQVFRVHPFYRVKFKLNDREFRRKTPFVFVGNNEYEMDFYNIGTRKRLDGGQLSIYFLHRGGRLGVMLLLFKTVLGMLRQAKEFEAITTDEITIDTRKKAIMVALDGEVVSMQTPLSYKIRAGELRVIVPKPEAESDA